MSFIPLGNIKYMAHLLDLNSPDHRYVYIGYMNIQFIKNHQIQPWIWLKYFVDIFFIWAASEKELDEFLEQLKNLHLSLKFTHERSREEIRVVKNAVTWNSF